MAPNGHASSEALSAGRPTQDRPRPAWLQKHGSMEFKHWQKEHPTETLSKKEWENSHIIDGLTLYYAAMQIWDESDSSSDEPEQLVETRAHDARAQSAREPKKTLKANGTGLTRSAGSATPSSMTQMEDLSPSAKKKRKARKKYLSQEIVASEESEGAGTATPITGATTPSAPVITVNGRRKSSNRKPRKKPISEETISPADEEDDPVAMNGMTTSAIASPLPVRSAPKAAAAVQTSEPPKKTILKLSTRKAPKKKVLSEETVLDDDTDESRAATAAGSSTIAAFTEPKIATTAKSQAPVVTNTTANYDEATASPDAAGESAAATRRGLRARRPAQQRPYSYDAQIFEDHDEDSLEEEEFVQPSPQEQSRRASVASLGKRYAEDKVDLDEETLAILQGEVDLDPDDDNGRLKHFKGKGRAWKKEESDEDLEFNPSKKKAARAKAKAKALAQQQAHQPKKRGRPRKSVLSEDIVRDDSDNETPARTEDASPSPSVSETTTKKTRKPTRKSALSEAFVVDDTDEDVEIGSNDQATALPEVSTPGGKKRGRPRKSDQSAGTKTTTAASEKKDDEVSYTPKGTPNKSYTPKGEPKSDTPKGEPKSYAPRVELNEADIIDEETESEAMDLGGSSELDSDSEVNLLTLSLSPPSDIEAHMASVNADDDDGEELLA